MEKSVAEPAALLLLVVVVAVAVAVLLLLLLLLLLLGETTAETGGKTPLHRYGCDPTSILAESILSLCFFLKSLSKILYLMDIVS